MAKDPYKYFRTEARSLLDALNQGVLTLEKGDVPKDHVASLLRHAHTLKGAARVVKLTAMADLAHAVEDVLSPYREGSPKLSREVVDQLLKILDDLTGSLTTLGLPKTPREEGPVPRIQDRFNTVRLDVAEVDAVLDALSEAAVQITAMKQFLFASPNGSAYRRNMEMGLDQAERELLQAHEMAGRLRLLPAGSLFDFLERAARDAAQTLGKKIHFEASGGGHRLDAPVLSAIQEALLHLVRNAVAHGIESESERSAAGKPAEGRLEIRVEARGERMSFLCRDDGKGLDLTAIRRAAAAKGLLAQDAPDPLSLEEVMQILMRGGVSTTPHVTEVSGRGVGLDVVRETAARLKGEIKFHSEPGGGTTVELLVPCALSTFQALAVESAGEPVLIPFDRVRCVLRTDAGDIAHSPEGDTILYDGKSIPFIFLHRIIRKRVPSPRKTAWPAIVITAGSGFCALAVDRTLGAQEILMRSLPALAPSDDVFAGASLDAAGNPCLVLNPAKLMAAHIQRSPTSPEQEERRPPLLIVDDSLTTRMLEQSILESAGYPVDLACSAEEAFGMIHGKRYGLFLVDVEMPGMSGFEFLEKTRQEAALKDIPAILVTSCSSPEDRQRGEAAGARDYMVKGEFDQGRLLGRMRELLGASR